MELKAVIIVNPKHPSDPLCFNLNSFDEAIAFTLLDTFDDLYSPYYPGPRYLGLLYSISCDYFFAYKSVTGVMFILVVLQTTPYELPKDYQIQKVHSLHFFHTCNS